MREGSLEAPVRHPLDWQNPDFYDEQKLDAELRRVFDICHGCRRCFNLCDSFPRLFDLIDASPTGELDEVKSDGFKPVVDACTLCDLCFMTKCPYVPPHEFNLDFPHLMLRYRALENKKGMVPVAVRELTKTDRNGALAAHIAPIANWASDKDNQLTRPVLEMVTGVHRDADLPEYNSCTFQDRAKAAPPQLNVTAPAYGRKAALYATCFVNYNNPRVGEATQAILAKNGVQTEVVYPGCCGMPQLEQGNIEQVVANARQVATALQPYIDDGYDIVALIPSCALMMKFEWPLLVPQTDPAYALVKKLSAATFDATEYVVDIAKRNGLAPGLKPLEADVALHIACHARAQNMGQKATEMLKLIPQLDNLAVLERCSGHGGSWGVMQENFPVALKVGKPVAKQAAALVATANSAGKKSYVASECPLAASHIMQGLDYLGTDKPTHMPVQAHPLEIFAKAYGIELEGMT